MAHFGIPAMGSIVFLAGAQIQQQKKKNRGCVGDGAEITSSGTAMFALRIPPANVNVIMSFIVSTAAASRIRLVAFARYSSALVPWMPFSSKLVDLMSK